MIAVDTQLLVYAHLRQASWHERARAQLAALAESGARWAIPWHAIHEFLAIVTNPRIYRPCSTPPHAARQVEIWMESPTLTLIGEDRESFPILRALVEAAQVTGGAIYDARIAAVCLRHGVTELWTADRDFSRYPALRTRNPLIEVHPSTAGERRAPWRRRQGGRGAAPARAR